MRTSLKVCTLALLPLAVACGDATGPGPLDQAEKTALQSALTASGAITELGAFTSFIINSLEASGQLSGPTAFDGVGITIVFNVDNTFAGAGSFVFGWTGLSTSANTVDALVSAGLLDLGASSAPTGTRTIPGLSETSLALGTYYEHATSSQYAATSGSVSITSASFSGTDADCAGTATVPTVDCQFTLGTMSGSFGFEAPKVTGTGAASYTQGTTTFSDLPAIRVVLNVTSTQ